MLTLQELSWERITLILAVGFVLGWLSVFFNRYIDAQADIDPKGPGSGIYVVIGTGYTLVGAFVLLGLLYGFETAMWVMVPVVGCFAVTGTPMIFGAISRHAKRNYREQQEILARQREETVKEWIDGNSG